MEGIGFSGDCSGGVLLEYVIINLLVVLALVGVGNVLYSPGGATFNLEGTLSGDNYGILGNPLVESWRRVMSGLSLPIP